MAGLYHHPRLEESALVEFPSDDVAASFSAHGDAITEQLNAAITRRPMRHSGAPSDAYTAP